MSIVNAIDTKKLLDQLGSEVLTQTKEKFVHLKKVASELLSEASEDVSGVESGEFSFCFNIHNYKFKIRMFDTVALSQVEDDEFLTTKEILTDYKWKQRYTGRIVFSFSEGQVHNFVLSEFLINSTGAFIFYSNVGMNAKSFNFLDEMNFNIYAKKMIRKGIEDAFFSIETRWRYEQCFDDNEFFDKQGTKIGFLL